MPSDAAGQGDCIGQFSIGIDESRAFAALSGDHNPVHVDPVFARRTVFRETVAHGVHVLLRSLDCLVSTIGSQVQLNSVRATFSSPVRMGSRVVVTLAKDCKGPTRILVRCGEEIAQEIFVDWTATQAHLRLSGGCLPVVAPPADLDFPAAAAASGRTPVTFDSTRAAELFPNLHRWTSGLALGTMLASTRIVGMECPGLHSIYSAVSLSWDGEVNPCAESLDYSVTQAVGRLSLIRIGLSGLGITGSLTAFRRPAPVRQLTFREAQSKVRSQAFCNTEAIVIGGSRGLGELVAKLLAAGGAKLAITYNSGREEAESVSEEIRAGGGSCLPLQFDVQAPMPLDAVATGLSALRHVYYFATPFITSGPRNSWDDSLFSRFCDYFVRGMVTCVYTIADAHCVGLDKLRICQPSTSFLDAPSGDFAEYVTAKAAAETAGNALAARHPGLTYCSPRIPRILTDQTNAMIQVDTEDAVPHAIRMLHAMHTSTEEVQHD